MSATHNAVFSNGSPTLPDGHFHTDGEVRATPVVVGNRLYVGNHLTGGLFAFDVVSGQQLWGNLRPYWRHAPNWVHDDMIVADGRVYLGYGNRVFDNANVRGTGASGVMALDPTTGATLWNHPTRGEVMPAPAYWHGEILAATGGARILALDAKTGDTLWAVRLPGWVSMSSPAIKGSTLYVGALNSVVAIALETHTELWVFHAVGSFTDVPPAISDGGILVITAVVPYHAMTAAEKKRWPHTMQYVEFAYGLSAKTGKLLWQSLMGHGPNQLNNTSGAPTVAHGKMYVGSPYTDSFFCFDVKTGKKLWEFRVNAAIKGAPVIHDGLVFFGDTKGFLHVLDADTGRLIRDGEGNLAVKRRVGGSLTDSRNIALAPGGPIIINDDIFVGSQDEFVYRVSIPQWLGRWKPVSTKVAN
jgi:outer membrane protein assembly factor BamB